MNTAAEARWLIEHGFQPVRLDPGTKAARTLGWNTPEGRFDRERGDVEATFAEPCNLGVETGEISGGLVDVDLDCLEAVEIAPAFLPSTEMIWGRNGERRHYGYISPGLTTSRLGTLVEVRSNGLQTMVPPSLHPDGGSVEWIANGRPAELETQLLREAVW